MSKELEALERIYKSATGYAIVHKKNDIKFLRKALTPPTADEVCEALSEYGKKIDDWDKVWFKDNIFYADEWTLCYMNKNGGLELSSDIDAKSHILLGKFYEKESERE